MKRAIDASQPAGGDARAQIARHTGCKAMSSDATLAKTRRPHGARAACTVRARGVQLRARMEIRFSPEEEAFRAEARAGLAATIPRASGRERAALRARREWDMAWQRRMYDAGWAGISWPREFGGRGATLMEQLIWYEEYARAGAPDVNTGF